VRDALGVDRAQEESQSLEPFLDEGRASSVEPIKRSKVRKSRDAQQADLRTVPLIEQTILEPIVEVGDDEDPVNLLGGVFRIIGQIHQLYILLEDDEGLLVIDQHAAHERVLYEELRNEVNENRVVIQELLQPFVLSLSPTDTEQILELAGTLEELGFSISSFGGNEVSISRVPDIFGRVTSETELISLLDRMISMGVSEARDSFMDELVKLTACHSALRAGQILNVDEIRSLIEDFSKTRGKYTCCHGRPTMIRIRKDNLDKAVGRLGHDAIQRFRKRHRLE
jgi:DNA mismatch repair protein MutL